MKFVILIAVIITIFYLNKKKQSSFSEVSNVSQPLIQNVKQDVNEIFHLDTRYEYPLTPPVNPIVYKSEIVNNIPANSDLFTTQEYGTNEYILNQPIVDNTNQLNYSGGSTQLIKIPLQFNDPTGEQLRTQEILITPYNRIKYGNNGKSC